VAGENSSRSLFSGGCVPIGFALTFAPWLFFFVASRFFEVLRNAGLCIKACIKSMSTIVRPPRTSSHSFILLDPLFVTISFIPSPNTLPK